MTAAPAVGAPATEPAHPGPRGAGLLLVGLALLVAGYIGIGMLVHVTPLYAGFLFALYWLGVRHADPTQFLPALIGAIFGVMLAWLLRSAPDHFGFAGTVVALAVLAATIYFQIRGQLAMVVNLSAMITLTVATIPALTAQGDFTGMIAAILIAAIYGRIVLALAAWVSSRRAAV